MRCPGQDWRYWKGAIAFEVPCPRCNSAVEFFKDENSGRCGACGHRLTNPKKSFDCAQWCAYAEECTGKAAGSAGDESAFASHLFQAVELAFPDDPRTAEALLIFQHAKELLAEETADSRCALAAAVLLPFFRSGPLVCPAGDQQGDSLSEILRGIGFEEPNIEQVGTLLEALRLSQHADTPEFKVVCDAERLARLASGRRRCENDQDDWNTDTARERARLLFQNGPETEGP
jgi:DNA-directed RNA polymerase subunit RPC12/RpoP